MGRPKKITGQHIAQIEKLAGLGLTQTAIAHVLGASAKTLYNSKESDEAVATALAAGKAKAEAAIGEALYTKAVGGDVSAIRWWEMTRANRSEKSHLSAELAASSYGVLVVPPVESPEVWQQRFSKPETEGE